MALGRRLITSRGVLGPEYPRALLWHTERRFDLPEQTPQQCRGIEPARGPGTRPHLIERTGLPEKFHVIAGRCPPAVAHLAAPRSTTTRTPRIRAAQRPPPPTRQPERAERGKTPGLKRFRET